MKIIRGNWLIWRAIHEIACRGASAVLVVLCFAFSPATTASTFSTDATDLWWNAAESGWGVNVVQQGDTLFLTFFVYGQDGSPTWYSGSDTRFVSDAGGVLTYSGQLHETRGIRFGGSTSIRQVGNVTMAFDSISTATLTYSVDGAQTTKRLTRYTFRENSIGGSYIGAAIGTYSGCPISGYQEEAGTLAVTHVGSSVTMTVGGPTGGSCIYSGTYAQTGRMGFVSGTTQCSNGGGGTFQIFEIDAGISGFTARATANLGAGCRWDGRLGGVRRGN